MYLCRLRSIPPHSQIQFFFRFRQRRAERADVKYLDGHHPVTVTHAERKRLRAELVSVLANLPARKIAFAGKFADDKSIFMVLVHFVAPVKSFLRAKPFVVKISRRNILVILLAFLFRVARHNMLLTSVSSRRVNFCFTGTTLGLFCCPTRYFF